MMNDEPLNLDNLIDTSTSKKRTAGKKMEGDLVRRGLTREKVASAKGHKLVKGRKRKTLLVPPELIERIDTAAQEEGVPLMDFYHWLLVEAFSLYEHGEIKPQVTDVVRVVRGLSIDGYNDE